jgi:hypothetical protein
MTQNQHLSDKAVYLLDAAVGSVFTRLEMTKLYGPADRYGVIEWAATVDDIDSYLPRSLDAHGVVVVASIAAWPTDNASGPSDNEYSTVVQVTVAASSPSFLARWPFEPRTMPNLESENETAGALSAVVAESLASSRTSSAVRSVISPENAPSDMTVLPLMENRIQPS